MRMEHWFLIVLTVAMIFVAFCMFRWKVRLYRGQEPIPTGLLGMLVGMLTAILGLAIGAVFLSTQLSVETFGPKVIAYRLRDPWLWGSFAVYVSGILSCLAVESQASAISQRPSWRRWMVDASILLSANAILFTLPFTSGVLRGMEQERFVEFLIEEKDYEALEDHLRVAMNHGFARQVGTSLAKLKASAEKELQDKSGDAKEARKIAQVGWSVGRYAASRKDPESILVAFDFLVGMTVYCTDQGLRQAADVFNDTAASLHRIARESFLQNGNISSTVAELDGRVAVGLIRIAEDKAVGREENLGRAIQALQEALDFVSPETGRTEYGNVETNLGDAYRLMAAVRDQEANLGKAIAAYEQALRVRTFEAFPQGYAMTQNNLGTAYRVLAEVREKETNLGKAIAAYGEALRVFTAEAFPYQHAGVKENLAAAKEVLKAKRRGT